MQREIFSPHNDSCRKINDKVIDILPTEEFMVYSADTPMDEYNNYIPIDFLNTINHPGFPLHELRLKKFQIVMLMRNINKKQGMCNGTHLIILDLTGSVLFCYNPQRRERLSIPRINLDADVTGCGLKWRQRQFPVQTAFAITINKSLGKTMQDMVGVFLLWPCFAHGLLYVAASRVTNPHNIIFAVPANGKTLNVVMPQVLI